MAATHSVEKLPGQRCPDCGGGFARDLQRIGYYQKSETALFCAMRIATP